MQIDLNFKVITN